jgi:hypothetical protein
MVTNYLKTLGRDGRIVVTIEKPLFIDYKMYYFWEGSNARMYRYFNAENDEEAIEKAKKWCEKNGNVLRNVHKVVVENLWGKEEYAD